MSLAQQIILITSATLGVLGVGAAVWKITKVLYRAAKVIEKELNHNSGESIKDYTKTAATESTALKEGQDQLREDLTALIRVVGTISRDGSPPLQALVGRVERIEQNHGELVIRISHLEGGHRGTDAPHPDLSFGATVAVIPTRETN